MKKYSLALLLAGILSAASPLQGADVEAASPALVEFYETIAEAPANEHAQLQRRVLLRLYNDLSPSEQEKANKFLAQENPNWNAGITPASDEEYDIYQALPKDSVYSHVEF